MGWLRERIAKGFDRFVESVFVEIFLLVLAGVAIVEYAVVRVG